MPTETLTILLVEANPREACLVQEMLQAVEAFQFQLIHVFRLEEALTCLKKTSSISVILLDWSLPDAQGIGTLAPLRLVSPDIPILVMSDCYDEPIALLALQKGAQDYLVKGQSDGKLLVRSIRHAIARRCCVQPFGHENSEAGATFIESAQIARQEALPLVPRHAKASKPCVRYRDCRLRSMSSYDRKVARSVAQRLRRRKASTFEQRRQGRVQQAQQIKRVEQLLLERTQELSQEKALLKAIVNSIQEGIYVTQPDGQVVLSNPVNEQIWGLKSEGTTEPLQQWLSRLQIQEPDGSVPTVEELPISRTLRGEVVSDYTLVIRCPNGEQKWISVNGATVRDQAGNVQLAIHTTRDITEHKRIEESLWKRVSDRAQVGRDRHTNETHSSEDSVHRLLGGVAAAMTQLLTATNYQAAMTRALTILSVAADVARVYIFENHVDEKTGELLTSQRFEWSHDQIAVQDNPELQNFSYEVDLPRWYQQLVAGKAVKGLVQDFPQSEREILEPHNIRSILVVPVIAESQFWGFICFADPKMNRQWTDHEESLLTVMAGSLGGAIIRAAKEQALRESEAKFRTLYESTSTAVILLDETGIFDGNSAALRMFGCTKREQLCSKVEESGTGKEGKNCSTQIQDWKPTFTPGRRPPSRKPSHLWTGLRLRMGFGADLTSHYAIAKPPLTPCYDLQSLHHPLIKTPSPEPPIGFSPPVQPNGEDSFSLANEYIARAIAQGSCRFDWMYCKRNGEEFPAEVTLTRIELGNRKVLQAAIYDISDRKATERQLLQAKEAAEAGSRAKSEFLAMMSHELRTPLNAVLGLSQLMRQEIFGTLNQKQKEYVSCIQSSGEHLLALINDILDLSKVEAGKEQLTFVPLDIQELCEYCLAMVREQANEQGLKLTLYIDPQVRIVIADERRCKQMLLNLLSNAVKFTSVGEVSLRVTKQPVSVSDRAKRDQPEDHNAGLHRVHEICFTVEDTGIGIASDQLPLLFEPFRQLDSGLNRRFPGTGLGLALTRSLARLHGGEVSVKSTLGQGSQFTVCLPDRELEELIVPSLPQETGVIHGQSCPLWAKSRILLVETDERSALVLKDYLQVIGHRVEHLVNGQDFLQKVRQFKPNLILMDVQLRGECTGFDLLAALRAQPDTKNLKVVMVTAMAMAGDRERCLQAGADDYLSKPIGIAQLEVILMRYL